MIAEIRGTLVTRTGDLVTLMTAAGVGYEVAVPLGVLERLPRRGSETHLYTSLVVREDSWALFGFDRVAERTVFQRLLSASGVGPRLALNILSSLGGERVVRAVRDADLGVLCTVPGVGKKKAERLVLELKDRMRDLEGSPEGDGGAPAAKHAVTALINLGYQATDAETVVRKLLSQDEHADPATLIRTALHELAGHR